MSLFGLWWADPLYWLGLLALPLMAWRMFGVGARGRAPLPTTAGLRRLPRGRARLWWLPDALRMIAFVVGILAVSRPQVTKEQVVVGEGVDVMLALDMSQSMNAVDAAAEDLQAVLDADEIPKNRFESAREILKRFVQSRGKQRDRIGLVVFGREAWLKYPLTLDYSRLVQTLDDLVLDWIVTNPRTGGCLNACTISGAGTAIGDALGRAYNRLRRSKARSKLVILITDGKQTAGTVDPLAIARHVRDLPEDEQVRMYTFLVGSQELTWLPQVDRRGRPMASADGRPAYTQPAQPFPVDPELLREIATMTGGKFYESYTPEKFAEDVSDLERTVFESESRVTHSDVFMPFLLWMLGLLLFEHLLRFTVFRSVLA